MSEQEQLQQAVEETIAILAASLKERAGRYLEGAQEDLDKWAFDIAESTVRAAQAGDKARLDELRAQALGVLEVSRLRAVKQADALLEEAISASISIAFALLSSGSSLLGQVAAKLTEDA